MKSAPALFLGLTLNLIAACGTSTSTQTESYAYDLTLSGCSTGHQEFASKQAMCDALRDDAKNNFCARSLRENYFKQNCSGVF